jgi:hypothetical protein
MVGEIERHRNEIVELCQRYGVIRLEVFGSAATGSAFGEDSDFDFLVDMTKGEGYADRYFGLLFALEDLFGRAIDLVTVGSIRNPYFKEAVEESKQLLYAA